MNQKTMNRTNNSTINASFQQKSIGLSLVITSSAVLYFIANVWPMRSAALAGDGIPAGYGGAALITLVMIVVAQIVLQTVLVIGAGSAEPATAVEQTAALKAKRNAYFVLVAGLLAAIGSTFLEALTPFDTATLAIVGLALAEIVKFASQLVYGRQ